MSPSPENVMQPALSFESIQLAEALLFSKPNESVRNYDLEDLGPDYIPAILKIQAG